MTVPKQRIGDISGWWSMLLRVIMAIHAVLIIPVISLSAWVVTAIFDMRRELAVNSHQWTAFMEAGPRYTSRDAERDQAILQSTIAVQLERLNSGQEKLRSDIEDLKKSFDDNP